MFYTNTCSVVKGYAPRVSPDEREDIDEPAEPEDDDRESDHEAVRRPPRQPFFANLKTFDEPNE